MKRMGGFTVAALGAVLGLAIGVHGSAAAAKDAGKDKEKQAAPAAAAQPAKPAEKIAYTFADQTKVDAFAKLWQQRQATVLRMTVLKSYFLEE